MPENLQLSRASVTLICQYWLQCDQKNFYGCKYHALVLESGYILNYITSEAGKADSGMAELSLESNSTSTVPGDKSYLEEAMNNRLAIRDIQLITPIRKSTIRKMIAFPNFSKRRKVIERVFSYLASLEIERSKSRAIQAFQL